jgi:two-component system chemotaxis response regulator CheY
VSKRILVVDDSAAIRRAIRRILESLGFTVEEAADGNQALTYCTEWGNADVILLDIDMPVMDGLSFLRELRANAAVRQPPVIICSTHNSLAKIQEALALGADEYIMKPFDNDIISSKLEQVGVGA